MAHKEYPLAITLERYRVLHQEAARQLARTLENSEEPSEKLNEAAVSATATVLNLLNVGIVTVGSPAVYPRRPKRIKPDPLAPMTYRQIREYLDGFRSTYDVFPEEISPENDDLPWPVSRFLREEYQPAMKGDGYVWPEDMDQLPAE